MLFDRINGVFRKVPELVLFQFNCARRLRERSVILSKLVALTPSK